MLNFNSLAMISDELVSTIEQSAGCLEQFARSPESAQQLQTCIEMIDQVRGTLQLIELSGAAELAEEMGVSLKEITVGDLQNNSGLLSVITSAFFVLPKYLEYVQRTRSVLPSLLIPSINEIRRERKQKPMPEGIFLGHLETEFLPSPVPVVVSDEEKMALTKRVRHMYQLGLLNIIKGQQIRGALGMMQRAMERMGIIAGHRASAEIWVLAAASIEALRLSGMGLTVPRKLLLSNLDRLLREVTTSRLDALDRSADPDLLRELYYLLILSGVNSKKVERALDVLITPVQQLTEQELGAELQILKGPSLQTFESMSAVLIDELNKAKKKLESLSQVQVVAPEDYEQLLEVLVKISDTMQVVGMATVADYLNGDIKLLRQWQQQSTVPDQDQLLEVADTFIYIESAISRLSKAVESGFSATDNMESVKKEIVASSQLEEAEEIVFNEMRDGLILIKRSLTSFTDSQMDSGHISNVPSTLWAIRGGFFIMGYQRAARILERCLLFVNDNLLQGDPSAALEHLLETFADAIISIEYYIDALMEDRGADDSVLEVAEESLLAMGYSVSDDA